MNLRSLVGLVLIFALVTGAVYVSQLNNDPVTVQLPALGSFTAPLWTVLLLTLLSGVFLALMYSLALTSREALQRWRGEKDRRAVAETRARFLTAARQLLTGDPGAALQEFREVTAREPGNAEAWLLGGIAARRAGDADTATSMHLRAQGLLPDDVRVAEELSRDAEAAGDAAQAIRQLQRVVESEGPTGERLQRLRDLLLSSGRDDEAVEAQRQLAALPADVAQRERALAVLRGMQLERAAAALQAGLWEEAATQAANLVADDPELAPAHAVLAWARRGAGDAAGAEAALDAGVQATASLELLRQAANLQVELEHPEQAIRLLREAAGVASGEKALAARVLLGRLYYRLELIDEARVEFESLDEELERSPVVDYYLAKILSRQGEHERAAKLLKGALREGGFLALRYRCPECDHESQVFGARCSPTCPLGAVQIDLSRDLRPATPVQPPAV